MKNSLTIRMVFVVCVTLFSMGFAMEGIGRAQQIPEQLYSEMQWRMIGPFRAGKGNAVAGVPGNPGGYYFWAGGGGGWERTDGGTGWKPSVDKEPSGSSWALALAPSNT